MAAIISSIGYFLPIAAFLLVFVISYAVIKKSKVLGESEFVMLLISFILASFFIVRASLVEFVQNTSAWFGVGMVCLFFLLIIFAFLPGEKPVAFLTEKSWFKWVLVGLFAVLLISSSSYVFNRSFNWALARSWAQTEWFGGILLFVIAVITAFIIGKKVKS